MTKFGKYLGLIALAGTLATGPVLAQTAPATTTAPAAKSTPAVAPKKERTAISKKCSADADAKGLHGKARKKFRDECKKAG